MKLNTAFSLTRSIILFSLFTIAAVQFKNGGQLLNIKTLFTCYATILGIFIMLCCPYLCLVCLGKHLGQQSPKEQNIKLPSKSEVALSLALGTIDFILSILCALSCTGEDKILTNKAIFGALIFFPISQGIRIIFTLYQCCSISPEEKVPPQLNKTQYQQQSDQNYMTPSM